MLDPVTVNTVRQFRAGAYACFGSRSGALCELLDAATLAGLVPSLAYRSLLVVHRRGWGRRAVQIGGDQAASRVSSTVFTASLMSISDQGFANGAHLGQCSAI
jgi:hypothetical protein